MRASPTARGFASTPTASLASLSASFSRWTTATRSLSATASGSLTGQTAAANWRAITSLGDSRVSLVSPVHLRVGGTFGGPDAAVRSLPLVMRLTLTLPEPGRAVLQSVGVAALLALGAVHRRRAGHRRASRRR